MLRRVLSLALLAITASTAAPVVQLPPPTGTARVGTVTIDLDTGRPEPFAVAPQARRRLPIQFWYPAVASGPCSHVPYMDAVTSRVVADTLPADFAARVLTDACATAAPITQPTRLPVVLFSHGLGATRFSSASLFEELASHGFVVAAIHHTYGSQVTVFADGTAVPWDERQWATPHDVERNADVWVADAESVLDLLPTLDRRPGFPLAGRLDLSRVGYAGHSFGGNAAVRTALRDARVRAVVDLDGRLIGKGLGKPVTLRVPLLALFNPKSDSGHDFAVVPSATVVRVPGTAHESFTDAPLLAHLGPSPAKPSAEGMIDAERAISLTRAAVLNFFDCALRGDAAACTRERQALAGAGALPFTR